MNDKPWVNLVVKGSSEAEDWFGQLDMSLEQFVALPDTAFVRMNHARWLEAESEFEQPNLVRNQDSDAPFEHFVYVRKSEISMVRPLRSGLLTSED